MLFFCQYYLGLQDSEDIIPDIIEPEDCLGSMRRCIMESGFAMLHVILEFHRKGFSGADIIRAEELMTVARLQEYKLFIFKQRILNNASNANQLKLHICGHFPGDIPNLAAPIIFDSMPMESRHKRTRKTYKQTSHRVSGRFEEMFDKEQSRKLLRMANDNYASTSRASGFSAAPSTAFGENHGHAVYETDMNVTFTASYYQKDFEELSYNEVKNVLFPPKSVVILRYLSSLLSIEKLSQLIFSEIELQHFSERFKAKDSATKVRLHRYFKYDGSNQGIPECAIHADKGLMEKRFGGHVGRTEKFDWVQILKQFGTKVLLCLIHNFYMSVT